MNGKRVLILGGLIVLSQLAAAAGGGGSGGGGGNATPRDPEYSAGVKAIEAKDWTAALEHMRAVTVRDAGNADAWNYMGYAYRKMGDMDNSFKHYDKALQLNPRHKGAHEYLGEAYLQIGDLASAEDQLKALDKICWLSCEEYRELKEKIEAYKTAHASN